MPPARYRPGAFNGCVIDEIIPKAVEFRQLLLEQARGRCKQHSHTRARAHAYGHLRRGMQGVDIVVPMTHQVMPLDRSMAEQRLGFPLILGAHDHQVCSRQHAQAPTRARAIAGHAHSRTAPANIRTHTYTGGSRARARGRDAVLYAPLQSRVGSADGSRLAVRSHTTKSLPARTLSKLERTLRTSGLSPGRMHARTHAARTHACSTHARTTCCGVSFGSQACTAA